MSSQLWLLRCFTWHTGLAESEDSGIPKSEGRRNEELHTGEFSRRKQILRGNRIYIGVESLLHLCLDIRLLPVPFEENNNSRIVCIEEKASLKRKRPKITINKKLSMWLKGSKKSVCRRIQSIQRKSILQETYFIEIDITGIKTTKVNQMLGIVGRG
jgi:hypothetical protein